MDMGGFRIEGRFLFGEFPDLGTGEPLDRGRSGVGLEPLAETGVQLPALGRGGAVHPDRGDPARQGRGDLVG